MFFLTKEIDILMFFNFKKYKILSKIATENTHYCLLFQSQSLLVCVSTTPRYSKTTEVTWYRPAVPRKYNSSFAR